MISSESVMYYGRACKPSGMSAPLIAVEVYLCPQLEEAKRWLVNGVVQEVSREILQLSLSS